MLDLAYRKKKKIIKLQSKDSLMKTTSESGSNQAGPLIGPVRSVSNIWPAEEFVQHWTGQNEYYQRVCKHVDERKGSSVAFLESELKENGDVSVLQTRQQLH